MLFFLHSTSVPSFYINVVLTLSICIIEINIDYEILYSMFHWWVRKCHASRDPWSEKLWWQFYGFKYVKIAYYLKATKPFVTNDTGIDSHDPYRILSEIGYLSAFESTDELNYQFRESELPFICKSIYQYQKMPTKCPLTAVPMIGQKFPVQALAFEVPWNFVLCRRPYCMTQSGCYQIIIKTLITSGPIKE